jgi:hypothetical protein
VLLFFFPSRPGIQDFPPFGSHLHYFLVPFRILKTKKENNINASTKSIYFYTKVLWKIWKWYHNLFIRKQFTFYFYTPLYIKKWPFSTRISWIYDILQQPSCVKLFFFFPVIGCLCLVSFAIH